jgi:hypothetical protein
LSYADSEASGNTYMAGYGNTTSAINAIDFKCHQETLMMVQYKCLEFYNNNKGEKLCHIN